MPPAASVTHAAHAQIAPPGASPWLPAWQAFVKVVEGGSMAAAARQLGCTRAQVSKRVAELESAFGTRLLERSTRRIALTPSGEVFLQHALQALESVAATQIALRNQGDQPHGVLRISASVSFGRAHIAPLLPVLTAAHPQLVCELVLTDQMIELADSTIDVALRITRAPPQDAVARRLIHLERALYAAPAYLAAHGLPAGVHELAQHQTLSFLMQDDHRWRLQDDTGAEHVLPTTSRVRVNSTDCLLDAALAGLGVAILPVYLAAAHAAEGRLRRVLPQVTPLTTMGTTLYACYMPSRVRSAKVRALIDALAARFDPVAPWERLPAPTG